ncbi:uncharacterized protein BDV17DRAFT_260788 [Aspergillus undulatus]|uniref:uncharacterized protein n=1 Tax=Aspergillus undulatus TaxID=1810928 RepID=UPI003CCE1866
MPSTAYVRTESQMLEQGTKAPSSFCVLNLLLPTEPVAPHRSHRSTYLVPTPTLWHHTYLSMWFSSGEMPVGRHRHGCIFSQMQIPLTTAVAGLILISVHFLSVHF